MKSLGDKPKNITSPEQIGNLTFSSMLFSCLDRPQKCLAFQIYTDMIRSHLILIIVKCNFQKFLIKFLATIQRAIQSSINISVKNRVKNVP
jgi:hypothetical protein